MLKPYKGVREPSEGDLRRRRSVLSSAGRKKSVKQAPPGPVEAQRQDNSAPERWCSPYMHVGLIFNHLCGSMDNSWPRSKALKGQFTQVEIMSDTDEHFSKLAAEFPLPTLSSGSCGAAFNTGCVCS